MLLYDFIETISGINLSDSKVVLNSPIDEFNPTVRLVETVNGTISDKLYSQTVAWNGNTYQLFKDGQYIVQLVKASPNKYVFGSVAKVIKSEPNPNFDPNDRENRNAYLYDLEKVGAPLSDFYGALEVSSDYKANRANKLFFSKIKDKFVIGNSITLISEFPGYNKVNVTFNELKSLIDTSSWKAALQNQKGIYLLRDRANGKQYVGSAYGKDMLWQRWSNYLSTGHGGDKELIPLGKDYISKNFSFIILETFNSNVPDKEIINCESLWKEKLGTRIFGYNAN